MIVHLQKDKSFSIAALSIAAFLVKVALLENLAKLYHFSLKR